MCRGGILDFEFLEGKWLGISIGCMQGFFMLVCIGML
jgi:hypothetical protein